MAKAVEEFSDLGIMSVPDLIEGAVERRTFVFDLETTGLNFRRDRIEGIAFYLPPINDLSAERVWYPFVKDTMVVVNASCADCEWSAYRIKATDECPKCSARVIHQKWVSVRAPMDQQEIMEAVRPLFSRPSLIAIGHGMKFDAQFLAKASGLETPIEILCQWADSMIAHYIQDERMRRYGLKPSVERLFGVKMTTYEEAVKSYVDRLGFGWGDGSREASSYRKRKKIDTKDYYSKEWSCKPLGSYAMDDVEWTWKLYERAIASMRKQDPQGRLEHVFWNIEMPITRIINEMESEGVYIDWEHLEGVSERLGKEKDEIYQRVMKEILDRIPKDDSAVASDGNMLFGWGDGSIKGKKDASRYKGEVRRDWVSKPPNFNAPDDVRHLLYAPPNLGGIGIDSEGLEPTASGLLPTSNKVLQRFEVAEPVIVKGILDWRSRDTIDSTFAKKIVKVVEQEPDGRLYARFNQTGTTIGRLSSSNPVNLMNQPRARDLIRKAFCSCTEEEMLSGASDMLLFGCDYDQVELKVVAHLSRDSSMLEVYRSANVCRVDTGGCDFYKDNGRCRHCDIHQRTAEDVGVVRQLAKALNFGLLYRMGPYTFCVNAGLFDEHGQPRKRYADQLSRLWFKSYPGIAAYHKRHEENLPKNQYISYTLSGRRRRLRKEFFKDEFKAVTQAIQFSISGTAQDIMKTGMRRILEERDRLAANGGLESQKQWRRVKFLLQIHDEIILKGPKCLDLEIKDVVETSLCGAANLLVPLTASCASGRNWDDIH